MDFVPVWGWCNIVLRCSVVWCGVYVVGGVGA